MEIDAFAEKCRNVLREIIEPVNITRSLLLLVGVFFISARSLMAYTVAVAASTAPAGTEAAFLANATNYMNANLYVNPFAPNTYQLTLYGLNPNYVPPVSVAIDTTTWFNTLNMMISKSSDTLEWGWGFGVAKERYTDLDYISQFESACVNASTSTFLVFGSTYIYDTSISSTTCLETLLTINNFIYQQSFPSPTTGYWEQ
jgi:hypothetical protein